MKNRHILYSYSFDAEGRAQTLDLSKVASLLPIEGGYHWIHMCALHKATRDFLENDSDLDPIIIDALLAPETRPRALIKEDGMLIILRAVNVNDNQDPEDMISIRMWIDDAKIITTRVRDIKAIEDIVDCIKAEKGPHSPCDFLTMITDGLFERMEPVFANLEDCISRAEELLASDQDDKMSEDAVLVRKRIAVFMRYVAPQKALLETLLKAELKCLREEHKEHLVESLDRVTRYVEELHELRDRSQILNDELNNIHGRRLNDITYIFSVAATVFLPLSFLTGLMGINIGGMPGVENDLAFWGFAGLCIVIVIVQVSLFRKLNWF